MPTLLPAPASLPDLQVPRQEFLLLPPHHLGCHPGIFMDKLALCAPLSSFPPLQERHLADRSGHATRQVFALSSSTPCSRHFAANVPF